ncbi:MAG: hypothetical protein R3C58_12690 [Parvularculaceae bacterium]
MNSPLQQQLLADLAAGAELFPHQYGPAGDQLLLVRLSSKAIAEASFLDDRVLPQGVQGAWVAAADVERANKFPDAPVSYVFHAGHCGSTLVSRLLGAASDAAALREPLPLRAFAFDLAEGGGAMMSRDMLETRLALIEKLWARGAPAVIKATSICTSLAPIAAARPNRKGMFMTQHPEIHLAVLLAGRNAVSDLKSFAQMRWRRLNAIAPLPPLSAYSRGELAALAWAAEGAAADAASLPLFDFDRLLAAPAETLGAIASALALSAPRLDAAVSGPILRQYSKSPDHQYDASLRAEVIALARAQHGDEIRKGMAWLAARAKESAALNAVLNRWSV